MCVYVKHDFKKIVMKIYPEFGQLSVSFWKILYKFAFILSYYLRINKTIMG